MRDNNRSDLVFGGKVIVFGGYFRQILLVIPLGIMQLSTHPIHGTISRS